MRIKKFSSCFLLVLCGNLFAQQSVAWKDLRPSTKEGIGTIYLLKENDQPLSGKYRVLRGLDEEHIGFSDGMMEGDYRRYRDGVLRESGSYARGKRDGLFTEYYQDGKTPSKETPMKSGKIEGTVVTYFRDGKKASEKAYLSSQENGMERRYDPETGEILLEGRWEKGKKVGEWIELSDAGHGIKGVTKQHYRDGKLDGPYISELTRDGKPYITFKGQYTAGRKTGKWSQYDATDGSLLEWEEK